LALVGVPPPPLRLKVGRANLPELDLRESFCMKLSLPTELPPMLGLSRGEGAMASEVLV
jgi:hypothetical protein